MGGNSIRESQKKIIKNTKAVSESFTVVPSLAVVLIGFTIFSIIIVTAYTTYDNKSDYINKFEISEIILEKIYSPNRIFIEDSSIINLNKFRSKETQTYIIELQESYSRYDYNFSLKLSCNDFEYWIPNKILDESSLSNSFASIKKVSIKINEISIVPGSLTIIFWEEINKVDS
mgnify:CR=1 FL=1